MALGISRERIVTAALELLGDQGMDALTVRALTSRPDGPRLRPPPGTCATSRSCSTRGTPRSCAAWPAPSPRSRRATSGTRTSPPTPACCARSTCSTATPAGGVRAGPIGDTRTPGTAPFMIPTADRTNDASSTSPPPSVTSMRRGSGARRGCALLVVLPHRPLLRARRGRGLRGGLRRGGLDGRRRARPVHAQCGEGGTLLLGEPVPPRGLPMGHPLQHQEEALRHRPDQPERPNAFEQ
ncbi:hypothetical protein QFZ63_000409 [Streptomyces sp. B3I7]|nr:hypothetical protein [Streptomyces sp. B3I7]